MGGTVRGGSVRQYFLTAGAHRARCPRPRQPGVAPPRLRAERWRRTPTGTSSSAMSVERVVGHDAQHSDLRTGPRTDRTIRSAPPRPRIRATADPLEVPRYDCNDRLSGARGCAPGSAPVALAVAGEVGPAHPARPGADSAVDRVRGAVGGRVLRDPVHRPVPAAAVRVQPRCDALDLAGQLLRLQRAGHRPVSAVHPGGGPRLPGAAACALPGAPLAGAGPGQVVATGPAATADRRNPRR